ncbi:MAG: hypothetical protein CR997_05060 [Acidobacteria bacterium]|nr:MAG: hypothetical protein CR997_05060 [Acidobacteriota bacterium]
MNYDVVFSIDVGVKRKANEDNFCANKEMGFFVVADGMGGHAAGEVASRIAVKEMERVFSVFHKKAPKRRLAENTKLHSYWIESLRASIVAANEEIKKATAKRVECSGMGTTVVALVPRGKWLYIAHVGDSRAYLFREHQLKALTSDHSWVNEQIKRGLITPEVAKNHPYRNVITQALGSGQDIEVDVTQLKHRRGDLLIMCSDGLNSMISNQEIEFLVAKNEQKSLEEIASILIEAAKQAGGDDNITVGILKFHS